MPDPVEHGLARPALIQRLNEALADNRLIVISAPLGFGKTSLASNWLTEEKMRVGMPVVWIGLDADDNDLLEFTRLLFQGLRQVHPRAGEATLTLIDNAPALPDARILQSALTDLAALRDPLLLVLDNCESLTAPAIHRLIRDWLAHASRQIRLMALTRVDPPWLLTRLRLTNQVCDIRAGDLQFSRCETREFINSRIESPLDDQTLGWLHEYTEGWPAALHMAWLAMSNNAPAQLMLSFRGTNRQITEYFAEEVFNRLPPATQQCLLCAAVPESFCAPLLDAMLASSAQAMGDSAETVTEMENAGLFIRPVDVQGLAAWKDCNLRASQWFEQNKMPEQAVHHALAIGDVNRAAGVMLDLIKPISGVSSAVVVNRYVRLLAEFSEVDLHNRIDLLCVQTVIAFRRGNNAGAVQLMQAIESQLAARPQEIDAGMRNIALGIVRACQGEHAYWRGESDKAIAAFDEALSLLPRSFIGNRNISQMFRAGALCQLRGKADGLAAAKTMMMDCMGRNDDSIMQACIAIQMVHLITADLDAMETAAQDMQAIIDARNASPRWRIYPLFFAGIAQFERNDLTTAQDSFTRLIESLHAGNGRIVHDAQLALALIAQLLGDAGRAWTVAQAGRQHAIMMQNAQSMEFSTSLEARLTLMNGQPQEAFHMLSAIVPANTGFAIWFERPRLTKAEVLLAMGGAAHLAAAQQLTEAVIADARRMHNTRQLIYALVTHSAVLQAKGDTRQALDYFQEALHLGRHSGYVHVFVALGKPVDQLLRRRSWPAPLAEFAARLRCEIARAHPAPAATSVASNALREHGITPLTAREMEVMALIAERQSIDEIAARLFISSNTVKKHLTNIYSKLNVKSGRQAVTKMRELGILPPVF